MCYNEPFECFLTTQVGGRPVKLDVTREENFISTRTRHAIEYDLKAGVPKKGNYWKRNVCVF